MKYILLIAALLFSSSLYADTSVSMMLGDVKIQNQGSSSWQKVKSGQKIKTGDTIQTGAGSFAEVNANDNIIRIQPKTKVRFGQNLVNNKPQGALSVFAGSVNCKMDKLKKSGDGYNVNTASAVCAVRGTEFDVAASADGQTVLQVTEGSVEFEGLSSSVLVAKNQESLVEIGKNPEPVKLIKKQNWEKWANESSLDVKGKEQSIIEGCLMKMRKLDSDITQLENEREVARSEMIRLFAESKEAGDSGDREKAKKLAGEAERNHTISSSKFSMAFYQASRIDLVKGVADNAFLSAEDRRVVQDSFDEISRIYTKHFIKYIKPINDAALKRQEKKNKK